MGTAVRFDCGPSSSAGPLPCSLLQACLTSLAFPPLHNLLLLIRGKQCDKMSGMCLDFLWDPCGNMGFYKEEPRGGPGVFSHRGLYIEPSAQHSTNHTTWLSPTSTSPSSGAVVL